MLTSFVPLLVTILLTVIKYAILLIGIYFVVCKAIRDERAKSATAETEEKAADNNLKAE